MSEPTIDAPSHYTSRVLGISAVAEDAEQAIALLLSELTAHGPMSEALRQARVLELATADAVILTVALARATGQTWEQIGEALHMSKQAAHERFARHV